MRGRRWSNAPPPCGDRSDRFSRRRILCETRHDRPRPLLSAPARTWQGNPKGKSEMDGVFRLYNVGQDTKFQLGGDKETSYMYELGFPQHYFGQCDLWAELIKAAAADLFDLVAAVVEKWVAELTAKAAALA